MVHGRQQDLCNVMKQAKAPDNSEVEIAKPLYDWQRFWIARTGTLDLSDGGFLADPNSPLRRSLPATPATLTGLAKYRALVLLGEWLTRDYAAAPRVVAAIPGALVLVTHDPAIATRCDEQLRIEAGRVSS